MRVPVSDIGTESTTLFSSNMSGCDNLLGKFPLYYHTVKHMKPAQLLSRIYIRLGMECSLGVFPQRNIACINRIPSLESLDFDPVFLARFPEKDLMANRVSFLHSSKDFNWNGTWSFDDRSALWNFNLHYFEFLFPLVKAWKDTGNQSYLDKTVEIINGWIDNNPAGSSPGWASYPNSLRIVSWISYYGYVGDELQETFKQKFLSSLHEQFVFLSRHLEKDILGNHYFENLKSLVLAALFFQDDAVLNKALSDFKSECKEEILADGMHFELSPMYHKIILEGMLRVAVALKNTRKPDKEIESYLQPMLDVARSFEDGLKRIPMFNDCGNNVAKSIEAFVTTADCHFNLKPKVKNQFAASGFYLFDHTADSHKWKLVVDAGQPGPEYIPGHAHCDAMSFELFCDGEPVLVNCGTYAYQSKERAFFRSTSAHNSVMIDNTEQSQCWGFFRLAQRSSVKVLNVNDSSIVMEMTDQNNNKVQRYIAFSEDSLTVKDFAKAHKLTSFLHMLKPLAITHNAQETVYQQPYAEDYGLKKIIDVKEWNNEENISVTISLNDSK